MCEIIDTDQMSFSHDILTSNQNGYYTECFEKNNMMEQVYMMFAKIPTGEKKFLYVYNTLKEFKKLPTECNQTNVKDDVAARKLRIEADELFINKDYASALHMYNKSLMTAIVDGQEYAFALANRSTVLFQLEEYETCISDIDHSLATKYPDDISYKLYDRKIRCLVILGKVEQSKSMFPNFLSAIYKSLLPSRIRRYTVISLGLFMSNASNVKKNDDNEKSIIKLLGGPNKNIPALSKCVKMKYSESMGRCLFASTDIKPGDILAIEKPYAGLLLNMSAEYNCRNCFKHCLGGLPCRKCTSVIYCDEACRKNSYDNGHKYECAMLIEFSNWVGIQHLEQLALNIFLMNVCKFGLENYIATIQALTSDTTDPIMRGFNADGKYLSDQFCAAYTLEGNETKRKVNDLFIRHCYASIMVTFLKLVGLKIPNHQLGIVGESLVHIMCIVSSNAHGITQYTVGKSWSRPEHYLEVASLLMPVLSLLNHHCDPNVVRYNYNGIIVLRAIQPIPKNSQLFDNYGKMYATHNKNYRQLMLNTQYLFNCECQPCKENWPTYDVLSLRDKPEFIMYTNNCLHDFKTQSYKLSKIISSLTENRCSNSLQFIEFLHSYLLFLHKNIKLPCKQYCNCQETIKEIFKQHADKFIIEEN